MQRTTKEDREDQSKNSGMSLLMMKHNQHPPRRFHQCWQFYTCFLWSFAICMHQI